jgi:N-acetylmuramoyl-L-alanine amidase
MKGLKNVKYIVIHCSATEGGKDISAATIDSWHKARGFKKCGYHFIVHLNGTISGEKDGCRNFDEIGAHVKGYNGKSIGICYIGGLRYGKPADTRTPQQVKSLRNLDIVLKSMYPNAEIVGHRDLSVDLNGDGVVTKQEWMKACPSFDVKTQF